MTTLAHRPARAAAMARQEEQIQQNVQKIEAAKRPSALALMAGRLGVSEGSLTNTLKSTVFKGCSDAEFVALVIVANEYKLNPLTKEIYAFSAKGGGIVPLVSIDGWVKIMNDHPQYDGIEFTDIPDENGKLIAIEAVIYRKDRSRPIRVTEYLDECKRNTDPWNKTPARMLRHRALIQCARYAFGFSGIYTDDDVEVINNGAPVVARDATPPRRDQITYDAVTGEIEDEETARELDRQSEARMERRDDDEGEGPSDDQRGESNTDSPADDIIARVEAAAIIGDVLGIEQSYQSGGRDMFDTRDQDRIEQAFADAKARLKGSAK